ncbi:MAG: GtrA family protein [Clostridiales bacterium]|nr:GtrA family protein [Clostridiales bacterium]
MIEFVITMYKKYEEAVNYLFFGFLAFLVNMIAYAAAAKVLGADNDKVILVLAATAFAWVTAVLFAYWTNRAFVFKSKVKEKIGVYKEFLSFISARVVTGLMELVLMYVMVDVIDIDDVISKFICNVIVIITNYLFSKLWVFRKKEA